MFQCQAIRHIFLKKSQRFIKQRRNCLRLEKLNECVSAACDHAYSMVWSCSEVPAGRKNNNNLLKFREGVIFTALAKGTKVADSGGGKEFSTSLLLFKPKEKILCNMQCLKHFRHKPPHPISAE